ncbi:uncharacterized protein (TIGR00369 family) [Rhodococcus sp. 27YEA15]|uniref:PaaI family thioesterase n=1 Tax=Rhodococcus sp. 27YEA15 TaxID=3156259 RepID=UPI003C7BBFEF
MATPTLEELQTVMPFANHLGITIDSATPELVTCTLPWRDELTTAGSALHGGALLTLADSAGAILAFLNLTPGTTTTTTTSTTNFLRAARTGRLTARSTRQNRAICDRRQHHRRRRTGPRRRHHHSDAASTGSLIPATSVAPPQFLS